MNEAVFYANDMYLNIYTFFEPSLNLITIAPHCYYVYHKTIGGSGMDNSGEMLFQSYRIVKPIGLRLAKEYHIGELPIIKCHRESLNFLNSLITQFILQGKDREIVIEKLKEYNNYDFVREASDYFRNDERKWDRFIIERARTDDYEQYYTRCFNEIGNVSLKQMEYKFKRILRSIIRRIT